MARTTSGIATVQRPDLKITDDVVQPFQLDRSGLRGRYVRLGPSLKRILDRHAYPEPVASLVGETVCLVTLLASTIKYDGIFTLQTSGDGPVPTLVADINAEGVVRGCARFDHESVATALAEGKTGPEDLLGRGYLAFTVDPGEGMDRYQGITELGGSLADGVRRYFRDSEQIPTGLMVACGGADDRPDGDWRAAGLLVQRLPESGQKPLGHTADQTDEAWHRTMMLMSSVARTELLHSELPPGDVIYRLFHEEAPRVYEPSRVADGCRCSRDRIENVLAGIHPSQWDEYKIDGRIEVDCEFCGTRYLFDDAALAQLRARIEQAEADEREDQP